MTSILVVVENCAEFYVLRKILVVPYKSLITGYSNYNFCEKNILKFQDF